MNVPWHILRARAGCEATTSYPRGAHPARMAFYFTGWFKEVSCERTKSLARQTLALTHCHDSDNLP